MDSLQGDGYRFVFAVALRVGRHSSAVLPLLFNLLRSLDQMGLPEPSEKPLAQYSHV